MINIKGDTYYIPGPVCIGIYVKGKECMIIDTGIDESSAKKILKELEGEGLTPKVIVNTHSHADHFGGNWYIRKKHEVTVCAPEKESMILKYPEFEPFYIFSSAPPKEILNKFFMGSPCKVDRPLNAGSNEIEGFEVEIIDIPGHSIGHIAIATRDNVLFCGDAVLGRDTINKYKLPYIYDVEQQIQTLEFLGGSKYKAYVMAHGGAVDDISPDVEVNLMLMKEIEECFMRILHTPLTREEILAEFVKVKEIELDIIKYPLLFCSVSAYIAYLTNKGKANYYFNDGKMYWKAI